jgi:hypothetical protein
MRWVFLSLLGAVGCFSPHYENGQIKCELVSNSCPNDFHCAVTHTCWRNGQEPPPQHSAHVVFSAGGGIGGAGDQYQVTSGFGQLAGQAVIQGQHSVQLGTLAGATEK